MTSCRPRNTKRRWTAGRPEAPRATCRRCGAGTLLVLGLAACFNAPQNADSFAAARGQLVGELRSRGVADERVLEAIGQVPRHEFMRSADREEAYVDRAYPIERGQTISQPYVVALMTEAVRPAPEHRVLEIGTGSGYQAAVLSSLVREVYSIEIDPVLAASAEERLRRLGYANVRVRSGDGFFGWPEAAPFDAIVVTAATPRIPERLVDQLREGGRVVAPVGGARHQRLLHARKVGGELQIEKIAHVAFVPMTGAVRTPSPEAAAP